MNVCVFFLSTVTCCPTHTCVTVTWHGWANGWRKPGWWAETPDARSQPSWRKSPYRTWLHLTSPVMVSSFLNTLIMPCSWICWWSHSSAFIWMCTHRSIYSFMHAPSIYDACTQVPRGRNPNHMAALNESGLAELSSAQSLWVIYTLLSITHVFLSSHASLIRTDRASGHSSEPWITPHSISERFLHIRNALDAVQDGYKSRTSPSQHGEGIGSANQTTRPLHYQASASFQRQAAAISLQTLRENRCPAVPL